MLSLIKSSNISQCICKNSFWKIANHFCFLFVFHKFDQMLMYLINFWKYFLQDILLFYWTFICSTGHLSILLDIYPFYWTKWKSVTGQKYFSTGHLNSPHSPLIIYMSQAILEIRQCLTFLKLLRHYQYCQLRYDINII